jgi:hypothetical protein
MLHYLFLVSTVRPAARALHAIGRLRPSGPRRFTTTPISHQKRKHKSSADVTKLLGACMAGANPQMRQEADQSIRTSFCDDLVYASSTVSVDHLVCAIIRSD